MSIICNSVKFIGLLSWGLYSSCGDSWLGEQTETAQLTEGQVYATTEEASLIVDGIAHLMYTTYNAGGAVVNGEGTVRFDYGNLMGQHFLIAGRDGLAGLARGTAYFTNATSSYCYFPWGYYYRLIYNANNLIGHIDQALGTDEERAFLKAQGLTFRAYSYLMLAQLYCKRWADDPAGSSRGLPLRLLPDDRDDCAASTLRETFDQIYADLALADSLYTVSGQDRQASHYYNPNKAVNNAVWAKALLVEGGKDTIYALAVEKAAAARSGSSLMSTSTYTQGFNSVTSETIWANPGTSSSGNLGSSSFFSNQMAYDRSYYIDYPALISKQLFDQMAPADIRRSLFLDPRDGATVTEGSMLGNIADGTALADSVRSLYPTLSGNLYAYMNFKFKCSDEARQGEGVLNLIRASEMVLIEAEAYYHLGNETKALNRLKLLNDARYTTGNYRIPTVIDSTWVTYGDSGYWSTHVRNISGEAVLHEIQKYRAIELWGEGHDWFDQKRWNLPISHVGYPDGNYYASFVFSLTPSDNNNWTWVYPHLEADYNTLVNSLDE